MRDRMMPCILGMNPPTKELVIMKSYEPLPGYACLIFHAEWPEGTVPGEETDAIPDRKGLACWLQFTSADAMRNFGELLIKAAGRKK